MSDPQSTSATRKAVDGARLIALLTEQRDLYGKLKDLAQRQRDILVSDRPERLLDVLGERQTIVGDLAKLNMSLAPYRQDWGGTYADLEPTIRDQANDLLQEINGMLQEILRSDREDSALLSARKQVIAGEIGNTSGARVAHAAYGQTAAPNPNESRSDLSG